MNQLVFINRRESISTFKFGPHYIHGSNKTKILSMIESRKSNEVFYVSETFSQVTPESAENGDFSVTGYNDFGRFYSLKETLHLIKSQLGCFELNNSGENNLDLYSSNFHTICYRTGTEESNCLHITGSKRNIERLTKFLERGLK